MEIGSHDRLQEGMLSLERANGARRFPNNEESTMEPEQQRAGSVPPGQDKFCDPQQQLSGWKSQGGAPGEPVHQADMEDARNLVAFSASLDSLPPSMSSSSCTAIPVKPYPTKLYEKFNQEMDSDGVEVRPVAGAPKGGIKSPEDMNTLQTALSRAKHGHKPPNCDCDGPDCPDYLEWLQKKIMMAANEDSMPCKIKKVAPHLQPDPQQPHHHPLPQHPINGAHSVHSVSTPYQQHQGHQGSRPGTLPCTKAPIPCSPQVLSIAKEKNVSLQTAIAIEALTQLSGTGPQAVGSQGHASMPGHIHQHYQHAHTHPSVKPQNGTHFSPSPHSPLLSSRSQSVPPGHNPSQEAVVSWEQNRPQSQGQPAHTPPLPSSYSCFPSQGKPPGYSPHPQQWQKGSSAIPGQRNQWMSANPAPPNSSIDPMSELKQLLGDTSGKLGKAPFKLPVHHQYSPSETFQAQGHPGNAKIKQEPDSGDYYHNTATMGHYGKVNGQQGQHYSGPPLSPGQAAICHSTQAALQQHLTHKRNLFSNHAPGYGGLDAQSPSACQNLKKWWPQVSPDGLNPLNIKQEPKEPKKKKSSQSKSMSGVLAGPPLPKPKSIVIKKTKQKASLPTFLPQNQISIQKASPLALVRAPFQATQPAGCFPSLPLPSLPTQAAAAGLPAPASSQVSISCALINPSSMTPALSESSPTTMGPQIQPAGLETHVKTETESSMTSTDSSSTPITTTPLTSTSSTSQVQSLNHIDPKYEDLMRQFEAEFGDSGSLVLPANQPMEKAPTAAKSVESESHVNANSGPDGFSSSNTQADPLRHAAPPSSEPHPAGQEMEINANVESGSQCEAASSQASQEYPAEEQQQRDPTLSLQTQQTLPNQHQPKALEDPFNMPFSPLPKRMKIEASGGLAVLSTTCYSEEDTPTKDSLPCSPSLRGFLESPLRYLDTPTKNLLDTPAKDLQAEFPTCDCVEQILEKDEGPYYNHLGSGPTIASIRDLMEARYGEKGEAVRIEKVVYTGREGKSSRGCPIAKWVVRRGSRAEKLMCLVRHRMGHRCAHAVIIILIMAWEGVPAALGDKLYRELSATLTQFGNPTSRRCGLNDDRTCACQGRDSDTCGASFSFGCSWSMYFNGCKYARSKIPRKFRLQGERPEEEDKLRDNFQQLATEVAPLYQQLAPQAFSNQCQTESTAPQCRLGLKEGRPFSGVTACMDFCAHAHKDQHNLSNGCTVVCTLTKEDNRKVGELPEDEQLHVLPLYRISSCDEFGSEEGQQRKMKTGALQVLQAFRREVRKLPEPAKSCRQRRLEAKKAASEKKKGKVQLAEKTVVKVERAAAGSPHPQGNKAGVKQEMKPTIKKEPFKGSMEDYAAQADPYNVYRHPAFYAREGLSSNDQPSPNGPINGYHSNPTALPYGYYNYHPNALFRPQMRTYEGIRGSWSKAGSKAVQEDQKPDVQSLQAQLAQSSPAEVTHQRSAYPQQQQQQQHQPEYNQSRPAFISSEHSNRGTQLIKQEPMDVPVYEGTTPSQSAANTPSTTPQPGAWPGNMPHSSTGPSGLDEHRNPRPGPAVSPFTPNNQQFYQQPPQLPSPYAQQWTSFPHSNTSMTSPAPSPSPSLKVPPSPSPSPHPTTPRPSTPQAGIIHPGLPQSGTSHPGTPQPGTPRPGTPSYWPSPAASPHPNPWGMEHAGYSPALKHSGPAGAYPAKMWPKPGESLSSTPLGLQENAWKSCGGSMAGNTPSPAPEGRLFPDALQQSEQAFWDSGQAESDVESMKGHEDDEEEWSDSEHNFLDPNIGGVAVAPAHGSVLIECARRELHATTPLKKPDRSHPTRISLVFYQHKNLNQPNHGLAIWEAKMKLLAEKALQRQQEAALMGYSQEEIKALGKKRKLGGLPAGASPGPGQSVDKREGPVTRLAPTLHTTSTVTVSPYAFTQLTGPYSHFV